MNYKTIKVSFDEPICFLQFNRPEANNTINELLVEECAHAISLCKENITIIVLEGLPDVFCFGADFSEINEKMKNNEFKYWRDDHGVHHVPKRDLKDIIID